MGTFFHGWRRKMGVLTLLLACLFMAAWYRSFFIYDRLTFACDRHTENLLISRECNLALNRKHYSWRLREPPDTSWESASLTHNTSIDHAESDEPDNPEDRTIWSWCAFGFGVGEHIYDPGFGDVRLCYVSIPYWMIAIPLTALSAYLLLSKPRPRKLPAATKPPDEAQVTHA